MTSHAQTMTSAITKILTAVTPSHGRTPTMTTVKNATTTPVTAASSCTSIMTATATNATNTTTQILELPTLIVHRLLAPRLLPLLLLQMKHLLHVYSPIIIAVTTATPGRGRNPTTTPAAIFTTFTKTNPNQTTTDAVFTRAIPIPQLLLP
ncbi:hypothetical protein QYM36_015467 [Artemia franciscana]|uniref:Uncharacterized protein n=1 Tax=Artemia franciscana TaxID=6661 RepID=A0AA88KXD3_ARTSF|nr:hypothetical protein QYM36_015467 [Artemia franciscana]